MRTDKPLIGAGIFAAFVASLCCITPGIRNYSW